MLNNPFDIIELSNGVVWIFPKFQKSAPKCYRNTPRKRQSISPTDKAPIPKPTVRPNHFVALLVRSKFSKVEVKAGLGRSKHVRQVAAPKWLDVR